jgi:hypothetical protein
MFEVFWTPSALRDLAALWIDADASLREAVTIAAAEIDSLLANSPDDVGESRAANRRITFLSPLGLVFEVSSPDRRVIVLHVWLIHPGGH